MKIDRLIAIIMMMLEHKTVRAQSLADKFEVSLRTVYRDLDALNKAGIPITAVPGIHGGFSIMEEYKVTHRLFTLPDIAMLFMGLQSMSTLVGSKELEGTRTRLKSIIPAEQRHMVELMSHQFMIDITPWLGNPHLATHMETIRTALSQQRVVSFSYTDRLRKNSLRHVEPYQLLMKECRWYLRAFCLEKQDFRLFKFTRIQQLTLTSTYFVPRPLPALPELRQQMQSQQRRIQLAVHASILDQVLEYCSEEDIISHEKEDWYVINFPFVADEFGYQILFGFGHRCICLSPEDIRQEMLQRIQLTEKNYLNAPSLFDGH